MVAKGCGRCRETKPASAFNLLRKSPTGLQSTCKDCRTSMRAASAHIRNERRRGERIEKADEFRSAERERYWRDRDKLSAQAKARRDKDPEKKHLVRAKKHRDEFPERYREYFREYHRRRRQSDPAFALNNRIRCAIKRATNGTKSGRSWSHLVGYGVDELMAHLEKQFVKGMGWHNRNMWHVDHIVPLSAFDFKSVDCPDFKRAWALTNLRPLWAELNLVKNAKREFLI